MANPNGNLAGWSDKSTPGWKEDLLAVTKEQQRKRGRERKNGMFLFFDDPFRVLLHQAAEARGLSITGYGRRATAAFIAHDLGMPFSSVVQHSAHPVKYGGGGGGKLKHTNDTGEGYGNWVLGEVKSL